MMTTLLAAALVIGPVIVFHEFGHFIVAKLAGIYVKTFSIGFGPKLLKLRLGETQYAVSAIPLGGYVKMAGDSAPAAVAEARADDAATADATPGAPVEEKRAGEAILYAPDEIDDSTIPPHRYFRNQSLAVRLAVVTAGPIANLVLAFVVLAFVLHREGMRVPPTTTLADVAADSDEYAAGLRGGDTILQVAGVPVKHALELQEALEAQDEAPLTLVLQRAGRDTTLVLPPLRRDGEAVVFPVLQPRMDSRLGLVKKDGPAWRAGLRAGDRIVEIEGQPVEFYDQLADLINPAIGTELHVVWERDGERMSAVVVPESDEVLVEGSDTKTRTIGRIQIEPYQLALPVGWGMAVKESAVRCGDFIGDTVRFLGILVRGKATRDALGGPIRIGQVAGSALRWSGSNLLYFLAFFSVNLFLLNLLPIPVLDGGHVVFILIEAVRGEALSVRTQELALKIGVSALLALMGFVVFNDLVRVFAR
ncbi:MAG TPA: RIP metalloprotease RseP [Candidatus Krumholzibacteria bacterium]|nr:RIP metalloprotease RseP [Candidatus Krumholzibacteria bacterium]